MILLLFEIVKRKSAIYGKIHKSVTNRFSSQKTRVLHGKPKSPPRILCKRSKEIPIKLCWNLEEQYGIDYLSGKVSPRVAHLDHSVSHCDLRRSSARLLESVLRHYGNQACVLSRREPTLPVSAAACAADLSARLRRKGGANPHAPRRYRPVPPRAVLLRRLRTGRASRGRGLGREQSLSGNLYAARVRGRRLYPRTADHRPAVAASRAGIRRGTRLPARGTQPLWRRSAWLLSRPRRA